MNSNDPLFADWRTAATLLQCPSAASAAAAVRRLKAAPLSPTIRRRYGRVSLADLIKALSNQHIVDIARHLARFITMTTRARELEQAVSGGQAASPAAKWGRPRKPASVPPKATRRTRKRDA